MRGMNASPIDEAQVRHMAELSRLSLSEEEVTRFTHQLGDVLEYASHLPELRPTIEESELRLDEDIPAPCPNPKDLLQNAAVLEDGYVKVPAILDRSES